MTPTDDSIGRSDTPLGDTEGCEYAVITASISENGPPGVSEKWDHERVEMRLCELAKEGVRDLYAANTRATGADALAKEAMQALTGLLKLDDDYPAEEITRDELEGFQRDLISVLTNDVDPKTEPSESLIKQEADKTGQLLASSWLQYLTRCLKKRPEVRLDARTLLPVSPAEMGARSYRNFERSMRTLPIGAHRGRIILEKLAVELITAEVALLPGQIVLKQAEASAANQTTNGSEDVRSGIDSATDKALPPEGIERDPEPALDEFTEGTDDFEPVQSVASEPEAKSVGMGTTAKLSLAASIVLVLIGGFVFFKVMPGLKRSNSQRRNARFAAMARAGMAPTMAAPMDWDMAAAMSPPRAVRQAMHSKLKHPTAKREFAVLYIKDTNEESSTQGFGSSLAVAKHPFAIQWHELLSALMSLDKHTSNTPEMRKFTEKIVRFVEKRSRILYSQKPDEKRYRSLLYYYWFLAHHQSRTITSRMLQNRALKVSDWLVRRDLSSNETDRRQAAYEALCLASDTLDLRRINGTKATRLASQRRRLESTLENEPSFVSCGKLLERSRTDQQSAVKLKALLRLR